MFLVCRIAARKVALPLASVIETMRPLPIEPLAGAPPFVRGVAIVRGAPTVVVDVAALVGEAGPARRFVTIASGPRTVALALEDVLGVLDLPPSTLGAVPPLLHGVAAVEAIGALDRELLLVLSAARVLPPSFSQEPVEAP